MAVLVVTVLVMTSCHYMSQPTDFELEYELL
jgi:hypothetical protein